MIAKYRGNAILAVQLTIMFAKTEEQKIIHLLYRTGFGPSIHNVLDFTSLSFEQAVDKVFQDSKSFIPLKWKGGIRNNETDEMELSAGQGDKKIRIICRDAKQEINLRWVNQMIYSDAQLREKIAFFGMTTLQQMADLLFPSYNMQIPLESTP